jgi:hypothetical protein
MARCYACGNRPGITLQNSLTESPEDMGRRVAQLKDRRARIEAMTWE